MTALVVACRRLDELPVWLRSSGRLRMEVLAVGALSLAELHDFCAARLGGPIDLSAAHQFGSAAGFVPGTLAWLLDEARRAGALALVGTSWRLVSPLEDVVRGRARAFLSGIDPATAGTLHRLALTEPSPPQAFAAGEQKVLDWLLETAMARRREDGRFAFRAPALAAALRALAPEELTAQTHRAALAAGRATPPAVCWALRHGEELPDHVVDAAVTGALEAHQWATVVELIEHALATVPEPCRAVSLHLRAVLAWRFLSDTEEAQAHLHAAAALTSGLAPADAEWASVQVAIARAELLHAQHSDPDAALDVLEEAAAGHLSPASRAELVAHRILNLTFAGRHAHATAVLDEVRDELQSMPRGLRLRLRIAESHHLVAAGRPLQALRGMARAGAFAKILRHDDPWADEELRSTYVACAWASDGPAAHPQLMRYLDQAADGEARPDSVIFHLIRATAAVHEGRIAEAHQIAEMAETAARDADATGMARALLALLAQTSALLGRRGASSEHFARAITVPVRSSAVVEGAVQAHLAAARLLTGNDSRATLLMETAREFTRQGHAGLAAEVLHSGVRFGRRRAAAALLKIGPGLDGTLHGLRTAHAQAVLDSDGLGLLEVASGFESAGLRLLALESWALAAHLEEAPDAVRRRAHLEVQREVSALDLSTHPLLRPLMASSLSGTLTRREQEIATLIASGLSNEDIALRLGLSRRTVEGHIGRLYRKNGLTRRAPARRR
ncbi:LuxR C-terminal-related transcriptional regulator [Bogoriella caseilytica]|uniref:LuxR C-terminal-related transcriptional regulator n=1 Tax=Bogoriella caseilytica TaxID=56055 RepID=UPI000F496A96|nr:LuxR C-terminal-related transcriptional regulator [Bogoriella caseilytica]